METFEELLYFTELNGNLYENILLGGLKGVRMGLELQLGRSLWYHTYSVCPF